jgi:hypothetical protein
MNPREPTFIEGMIAAFIPLAAAILVAAVCGFLVYLFWFGTDGLMDWLF